MAQRKMAPFPVMPVMTIALGQLSQYYFWTSPFAYAGYMVEHLGVVDDKDQVGYYAGVLASSFAVGRIVSAYLWGLFGDRHGHVPVVYISMTSIAICSIGFGFSTTFYMAFAVRFIAGVLSGQSVAGKSLISDVCGEEHEIVGMGILATSWSLGLSIGPGLGGLLAEPATFFPETFSQTGLFGRFPYLLPNLVGSGLAVITLPMAYFFLARQKTVEQRSHRHQLLKIDTDIEILPRDTSDPSAKTPCHSKERARGCAHSTSDTGFETPHCPSRRSSHHFVSPGRIFYPSPRHVRNIPDASAATPRGPVGSIDYAAAVTVLPPSVSPSPREDTTEPPRQRVSFTEDEDNISVDGSSGATHNVTKLLRSERLLETANVRGVIATYALYLFVYSGFTEVFPLWALSSAARGGLDWSTKDLGEIYFPCGVSILIFEMFVIPCVTQRIGVKTSQRLAVIGSGLSCLTVPLLSCLSGAGAPLYWASLLVLFSNNACFNAIFLNISVAINNCSGMSQRGEVNGLATTCGALAEAIGPVFFSVLFATSINHDNPMPLDFHLVFLVMASLMVLVLVVGWHSVKTVYGEDSVAEVQSGSGTDQAGDATGARNKSASDNVEEFPVCTADSAVYV